MNVSVDTPLVMWVMTENQTMIVIAHVLVIIRKYVGEVGEIVSTGLVCIILV